MMIGDGRHWTDELDAREKVFALELVTMAVTLPLLRVLPREVSASLLSEVRHTLPPLVDGAMFDAERVAVHIRQFADQVERILALEIPPDVRPN